MRKILCALLLAALAAAFASCGDSSPAETTGSGEPVATTATGQNDTTADTAAPEETTGEAQTTAGTEESTARAGLESTPESSEPEQTTNAGPEPIADKPVVVITNGEQSLTCMLVEQSAGIMGGFDLTEDYGTLPLLSGTSFSLVMPERDDVYYASYMLYNSEFEAYGPIMMNDEFRLVDSAFGTGIYYVRIAVNVGSWFDYTDAYYAYAALEIK